jgi:general secretion pathway protein G
MMLKRIERRPTRGAFTLMEMLIVVAIIVMLAGISAYSYMSYLEGAREKTAKIQITQLEEAVMDYNVDNGTMPDSLQILTQSEGGRHAKIEAKQLNDPWGKPYAYEPNNLSPTGKPRISTTSPGGLPISNW